MQSTSARDAQGKGNARGDPDASVVAISGILDQEQEWNGKTVLRPIAYRSKVLSDAEMKYRAPKDGFSFMDKETYDSHSLTRWLEKSRKPIEDHPELPAEHETREILKRKQ